MYPEDYQHAPRGRHAPLIPGGAWTLPRFPFGRVRVTVCPLCAAMVHGDGVDQLWLTTRLAWDTRDSLAQAYRGSRVGLSASTAWQTSGEWGSIVSLDAQQVVPLDRLIREAVGLLPDAGAISVPDLIIDSACVMPLSLIFSMKSTASATSSVRISVAGSRSGRAWRIRSVSTPPGQTARTLTPEGAASVAMLRVSPITACLLAP